MLTARTNSWDVLISEQGRCGTVVYRDPAGTIACPWEFGGGEVVASVSIGTEAEWRRDHPWTAGRRAEILARLGSEIVRQRAPSCDVEIEEARGWMHLVQRRPLGSPAAAGVAAPAAALTPQQASAQFVRRFTRLRATAGIGFGVGAAVLGLIAWIGRAALSIETTGTRFGDSVRVGNVIATMMQRLEPYVPSLHRDASKDRYSVGVLLHAADGSVPPRYLEIEGGLTGGSVQTVQFIGTDATRIWFRASEVGAIDLATGRLLSAAELAKVQSLAPKPTGRLIDLASGERARDLHLAMAGLLSPTEWIATASEATVKSDFKTGSTAKPVVDCERSSGPDLVFTAQVDRSESRPRLEGIVAQPNPPVYHASLLRTSRDGPLLVLAGPTSVLRLHWKSQYRSGTVFLSRLDASGTALWECDLGLAKLDEVLPDPLRPAFIGTRPTPANSVAEPVLVIVDAATGSVRTHSLWMKN